MHEQHKAPAPHLDPLTGRLKRAAFLEEAARRLAAQPDLPCALFVLDIDGMHAINADCGLDTGDAVLRTVATRTAPVLSSGEFAGRLDGDEFAFLVFGAARAELAAKLAERMLEVLDPPIRVDGRKVFVSASIGVATREGNECAFETLLARAGDALREAKAETRRSFKLSAGERPRGGLRGLRTRHELQQALERDEIEIALQPIFDAKTVELRTAEVLARWNHATYGQIAPSEFVPVAERTGIIVDLGWRVLEKAVIALSQRPELTLAVNVSPLQFRRHGFSLQLQDLLHAHKVAPERLEIEITENALICNAAMAERTLRQLREVGVKSALDDFGTGYSSLSYLQRLAFDKLKLDQSFARELNAKSQNTRLVRSIIDLGHSLGLKVVAEGVENRMQASALSLLGCDYLQGYALGVPLDVEAFCAKHFASGETNSAPAAAEA